MARLKSSRRGNRLASRGLVGLLAVGLAVLGVYYVTRGGPSEANASEESANAVANNATQAVSNEAVDGDDDWSSKPEAPAEPTPAPAMLVEEPERPALQDGFMATADCASRCRRAARSTDRPEQCPADRPPER